jgi:cell division protein FtsB
LAKPARILLYTLGAMLLLLQYPLWFGSGGLLTLWQLRSEIDGQKTENAQLRDRNATLEAEVSDLKQGMESIEERARAELGMVKKGETFYQVIDAAPAKVPPAK